MGDQPQRPLRVLFGIGGIGSGGSETQMTELAVRIDAERIRAAVVISRLGDRDDRCRRIEAAGIPVLWLGPMPPIVVIRGIVRMWRFARVIGRLRPDVIYAWLEESSVFLVPLAKLWGIPVVVARRNVIGARAERFAPVRWAIRQAEAHADLVTGNSEAVLAIARSRGVDPARLRLVRNGHPERPVLPVPPVPPVVLGYLARFRVEKGHHRLLDALEHVRAATPWAVRLGGDGPLLEEIRREVRARGLNDRIIFVGDVTEASEFWSRAHVAVLLSDHEGSPNALMEAAMAGRPLVATDAGGTAELVRPDGGILVPLGPPEEIAAALTRLIDDHELREDLGRGARAAVLSRHAMQTSVDGHIAVLEEAGLLG